MPGPYRRLYEGHIKIPGQLWFEDRRVLYETVRRLRPQRCFEIGTWLGGGSTLMVARALRENGSGTLHTIETLPDVAAQARELYARHLPELAPFVEFHQGDYREVFPPLVDGGVDFFVLDGAEDAEETIEQFEFFDAHTSPGASVFAHDWLTEKCRLLRPRLDGDGWRIELTVGPPKSVGLAVAAKA